MSLGSDRPLIYPLTIAAGALATCCVFAVPVTLDQLSAIVAVAVAVVGYTAFRLLMAQRRLPPDQSIRRVRQQHRLTSRSWIEHEGTWTPVYFDPALVTLPTPTNTFPRLYPAGRDRHSEPPGKLIDNPTRPDPDGAARAHAAASPLRRLTLDAQQAIAAPFIGLMWVYIDGGGVTAFAGATCVAGVVALWLAAINGSDPS